MVHHMTKRHRTNLYQWIIDTIERFLSIQSQYSHWTTVYHNRVVIHMAVDILAHVCNLWWLVSNVEAFYSLALLPHLGMNRSAFLAFLTRSCRKSTSSTAYSRCRHFRRCCINGGHPLKTVVSCPCTFGTLIRIPISSISRPEFLYPHCSASTLYLSYLRIGCISDSIVA